jgi:hypothetical protein
MGSNAFLDIAIALVLMYLVLSMLVTVINEFIATQLDLRASTLKDGIQKILQGSGLQDKFYAHGVVAAKNAAVGGNDNHVSYMSGQTFALAVLGNLDPKKPMPGFEDIRTLVENLPASNIKDTLRAQLAMADGNLQRLRDGVARSFDATMDRLSGVYKRYLKWISLLVGLALACALNADTIAVASALWRDASLRTQAVQAAAGLQTSQAASAPAETITDLRERIRRAENNLRPLPIGWHSLVIPTGAAWLVKIAGLIMTGLALSLGAPFWFDLLSKFMNVRGAGQKPARTASS